MLIKNEYKPKMLPKQAVGKKPVTSNGRIVFVLGALGIGFLALIGRGLYLQTSNHEFLTEEGNKRFVRTLKLPASRGVISDRNGATLALSAPAESLYAIPSEANLTDEQIEELSGLIDLPSEIIRERLDRKSTVSIIARRLNENTIQAVQALGIEGLKFRKGKAKGDSGTYELYVKPSELENLPSDEKLQQLADVLNPAIQSKLDKKSVSVLKEDMGKKIDFVFLKRQMKPELAKQIADMGIKGLAFQKEPQRHYPMGSLFAQIIGFTNIDGKGQEGLELSREKELHGKDGQSNVLRDNKGQIVENIDSENNRPSENGSDIVLALDQRIQTLAYDELTKAIAHHQAKSGSAVVLDARTGEILALVNGPSYDPNEPAEADSDHRRNRAVTDMYEFGSVLKPFPIAKALDDGKISTRSHFDTRPYNVGGHPVRDTHLYPSLDVRGIMQKSSNVGTSKISLMYSPEEMHSYYRSIGFGKKSDIRFPGESTGALRDWKKWGKFEQATMSFGYGMQLSLLQLARAYTIFTADGKLMPVSLEKQDGVPAGERILKPETAKAMRQIMVSVTEKGGTGQNGAVEGFNVAAKTGTAQKVLNGRYAKDKHIGTFIGFAPAENPRVIVAVAIDEPRANGYYGGVVAGPAFKGIMAGTLNILGVHPTNAVKAVDLAAK